jgi:hypothetical protein
MGGFNINAAEYTFFAHTIEPPDTTNIAKDRCSNIIYNSRVNDIVPEDMAHFGDLCNS